LFYNYESNYHFTNLLRWAVQINDLEKAKPHLDGMIEATKKEAGCVYYGENLCLPLLSSQVYNVQPIQNRHAYVRLFSLFSGWTINDNKLFCRETYVDGTAASIHLSNAGPLIEAMLESGACSLDSIAVMVRSFVSTFFLS
jgi:hypothetical protein